MTDAGERLIAAAKEARDTVSNPVAVKQVIDALSDIERGITPDRGLIEKVFVEWVRDRCSPEAIGLR